MGVQFTMQGGSVFNKGVNIPWMKIDPRVNLPWGSKYHMTQLFHHETIYLILFNGKTRFNTLGFYISLPQIQRHDITEILLMLALNTNQSINYLGFIIQHL